MSKRNCLGPCTAGLMPGEVCEDCGKVAGADLQEIPYFWKIALVAFLAVSVALALGLIAWSLIQLGDSCESEAHLSDLCGSSSPGVPGKEGRS